MENKKVRCAIYTRKSNLDKEDVQIESIKAQREACMYFIISQKGNGWIELPEHYDDDGYTGGTLDRPALQRLQQDVADKKIDKIVVYKFDRLSRTVAGHIHLEEFLDAYKVEIISVTEGFNKSAAGVMNRNALMVFSQFERDLSIERTRNAIATSKRNGLWMGGLPPFGYKAVNKQLVVVKREANIINFIFDKFIETASVVAVVEELRKRRYLTRRIKTKNGMIGGKIMSRSYVYGILNNILYLGKIKHYDNIYEGKHGPIISQEQWDQVRNLVKEKPHKKYKGGKPSYLKGLIRCGRCDSGMVMSFTTKKEKRYRYYKPHACANKTCNTCPVRNTNADKIESLVISYMKLVIEMPEITAKVFKEVTTLSNSYSERNVSTLLNSFESLWENLPDEQKIQTVNSLVGKIIIFSKFIDVTFNTSNLIRIFDKLMQYRNKIKNRIKPPLPLDIVNHGASSVTIRVPKDFGYKDRTTTKIIISDLQDKGMDHNNKNYNKILVETLSKAFVWSYKIENFEVSGAKEIALQEDINIAYVGRLLRLTCLAPDIIEKILTGNQPKGLKVSDLTVNLPDSWEKQRKILGM